MFPEESVKFFCFNWNFHSVAFFFKGTELGLNCEFCKNGLFNCLFMVLLEVLPVLSALVGVFSANILFMLLTLLTFADAKFGNKDGGEFIILFVLMLLAVL